MRTALNALVTEKCLSLLNSYTNLIDVMVEGDATVVGDIPLKNVCAKVSAQMSDEIDSVVSMLGVSKRRFLEAAFYDAIQTAKKIMEEEGVFEALDSIGEKGVIKE